MLVNSQEGTCDYLLLRIDNQLLYQHGALEKDTFLRQWWAPKPHDGLLSETINQRPLKIVEVRRPLNSSCGAFSKMTSLFSDLIL